jgi:proteasome lid subunit RPN8/RPN11
MDLAGAVVFPIYLITYRIFSGPPEGGSRNLVTISRNELQFIINHAEKAYPEECCGFLLGVNTDERRILRALLVPNANKLDRGRRYNIDPIEIIRADEIAQKSNLEVIGVYHSHPGAPPRPSQVDLENAWPWYTYLVVAVENGHENGVGAWKLSEDRSTFQPVKLIVENE